MIPTPAVGVVCLKGDEVLLIRRGTPPRQGEWSLPGGRIEPGERLADAALRELRVDGVRKLAMDVRELDVDLIDSINPFATAYAVLAKSMNEATLKQVQSVISARRTTLSPEEAKDFAVRAARFKRERGRLPSISAADPWEQKLAEGAAAFVRYKDEGRYGQ